MSQFTLETFGEIIDKFLEENEVRMLLTLPAGSKDVQVEDSTGLGCTVRFYILLNAIKPIVADLQKHVGIPLKSREWEKVVDALLQMVKEEMLANQEGANK